MELLLNTGWGFRYGEELEGEGFSPVALPHTFQLPYYGDDDFYVGYGVYKKRLILDGAALKGVILFAFEGVFQHVEAWLNGIPVGEHFGGYTAFDLDLTAAARAGENELILRVDNLWRADLPPRAGEHVFCGGIYRDVSLCLLPKSHIERRGVFVYTRSLTAEKAVLGLEIALHLEQGAPEELAVEIFDGETRLFSRPIAAREKNALQIELPQPKPWSPESPHLYTLRLRFGREAREVRFGVRTIRFDRAQGFFLNGRHYPIEGVNVHQDHGGWGDAVTRAGITRDLLLVKQAGFNFVRGSHYPKHSFFARECDRLGLLFWCEAPFWGIGGFGEEGGWNAGAMPEEPETAARFSTRCVTAVEEMIHAVKNSPSVIVWSMGNEIFFCKKEALAGARALAEQMVARAKALDPTRPAGLGGTQRGDLHTIGDVTGFNGDGATLFTAPPVPSMVSEYGSVVSSRPGKGGLRYGPGTRETPQWRAGRALWCAFHHGSIAGIGKMGIIDLYRMPLCAYYDYRKALTGVEPPPKTRKGKAVSIRLTADRLRIGTDGTDDCMLVAAYYDANGNRVRDSRPISLRVVRGEGLFPTGNIWTMQPGNGSLADGSGAIELRAYRAGEIVVEASAPGVSGASLTITAEGAQGCDVVYPAIPAYVKQTKQAVDILFARPVSVSSECAGARRDMANDGKPDTFWQPEASDRTVFWQADTEGLRTLSALELELGAKKHRVCVDVSEDGEHWRPVYRALLKKRYQGNRLPLKRARGRFLRVRVGDPDFRAVFFRAYEAD